MNHTSSSISRRRLVLGSASVAFASSLAAWPHLGRAVAQEDIADSLVIDLDGELESINPSLAYSGRDWSVVNSI